MHPPSTDSHTASVWVNWQPYQTQTEKSMLFGHGRSGSGPNCKAVASATFCLGVFFPPRTVCLVLFMLGSGGDEPKHKAAASAILHLSLACLVFS